MAISEQQFTEMLKGTVHEGKYEKEPKHSSETAPKQHAPSRINTDIGNMIHRAAPGIVFAAIARIITTPAFWILLAINPLGICGVIARLFN